MKPYLICLEIQPVEVGERYDTLPLHCTLVHWFWLPNESEVFDVILRLVVEQTGPELIVEHEDEFTATTLNGSVPVRVSRVQKTTQISTLHETITAILEKNGVRYSAPHYVHEGYAPHITHRRDQHPETGDELTPTALYIVGAKAPEFGTMRRVVKRLAFKS